MSARAIAIHGYEMSGERRANLEIKSECPALLSHPHVDCHICMDLDQDSVDAFRNFDAALISCWIQSEGPQFKSWQWHQKSCLVMEMGLSDTAGLLALVVLD